MNYNTFNYCEFVSADSSFSQKTLIIAEAGINHQRSFDMALRLVDAAQEAGADIVKFQLERPSDYTLTFEETKAVYQYCESVGMPFSCTAFDVPSFEFLLAETRLRFAKIASCDARNEALIGAVEKSGLPIIQSLKYGDETYSNGAPRLLLHVVAEYPTAPERARLSALKYRNGLSDHSVGMGIPIAAVALGAHIIEKHLTLDRSLPGPDHACSLSPGEFAQMVRAIRDVELALKEPHENHSHSADGRGEG